MINSNYCQKEDFLSERSRRLLSIFPMVLRRVRLSVICVGQWRRLCAVKTIFKPQLQNAFKESWKLCWNLCSHNSFRPGRSLMINWIPLKLWLLKNLLADRLINFRALFLKILQLLQFLMLWSSYDQDSYVMILCYDQVYSMIGDGKNEFFKKVCLVLKKRLCVFLVT